MAKRKLNKGLWYSEATASWHYEFKQGSVQVGGHREPLKFKGDTGLGNFNLAQLFKDDLRARERRRAAGLPLQEQVTLRRALSEWEEAHQGVLADNYVYQMGHLVRTHLGRNLDLPLESLTSKVMESARKGYLAGQGSVTRFGKTWSLPHSSGGANTLLKMVSALYGWIIKQRGWVTAKPFRVAKEEVQQEPRPVVWPEQVPAFLEAVKRGTYTWKGKQVDRKRSEDIQLSIWTQLGLGLRETESLGVRWEWISWRQRLYQPGATKNRKTRQVPIAAWLFEKLEARWIAEGRPAQGLVMSWSDEKGRQHPHVTGCTRQPVEASGVRIGIVGLHPHRLRATFATAHFEAGTPLVQIQLMMGHKDPSTTMKYIESRPQGAAEAQEKVAKMMGQSPSGPPPSTQAAAS